jgi:centromeric protein E
MRPLNLRKQTTMNNCVWRVHKNNSITQCTSSGKPLPKSIKNHTFFTFDKTFGESSTTREVYEQTSRGIVDSVMSGLNGTIFAYGQSSSGKTFTMQGSGTLHDGALSGGGSSVLDNGGIVHMAVSDIFNHIEQDPERVFSVRVSFIEIYNEEVRDLLVSGDNVNNAILKIWEDKALGFFVNPNESIVTSMKSLVSVLFAGKKNQHFADTAMNERSLRSHTVFRIKVESRLKDTKKNSAVDDGEDSDDEDLQRDSATDKSGAVRVSTLNLVDLAGFENVRHTGATEPREID